MTRDLPRAPAGSEKFECIVLAAGASARMGQWKLFLPFQGRTVIECVVRAALTVCSRVILVTGFRSAEAAAFFSSWAFPRC